MTTELTKKEIEDILDKILVFCGPPPPEQKGTDTEMMVKVPFCGLYDSPVTAGCDFEEELLKDSLLDRLLYGTTTKAQIESGAEYVGDFELDMREVYDKWIQAVEHVVKESTGVELSLRFANIWSPMEYNFYSDVLCVWADKASMRKLIDYVLSTPECKKRLDELVEKATTPRDGYMPFYSPEDYDYSRDDIKDVMYEFIFIAAIHDCPIQITDVFWDSWERNVYEAGQLAKIYEKERSKNTDTEG